ncbi:hypothetical protein NOCA2770006 [metagenome]|uniref:Uncharacterized protein n=1 Tax=metagenome TaxID=256318 RepID=A0A2P2CEH1_9ZZZZ
MVIDHEGVAAGRFNKLPMFELQLTKAEALQFADALRDLAVQL